MYYQNGFFNKQYAKYKRSKKVNFQNVSLGGNTNTKLTDNYLYVYDVKENDPVVHSDYPWGFKFRTKQRYWVETNKQGKQRLCYQTLNPKNDKWCAVKKTTYSKKVIICIDLENEYVKSTGIGISSDDKMKFLEKHKQHLSLNDIKDIEDMIKVDCLISKHYENINEKVKERDLCPVTLDLESKTLWDKSEIAKSSKDIELYRIYISVFGVKKRCRKAESHYIEIGYSPKEFYTLGQILNEVDSTVMNTVSENMRSVSKVTLRAMSVKYIAPTKGSMFHSFNHCISFRGPILKSYNRSEEV